MEGVHGLGQPPTSKVAAATMLESAFCCGGGGGGGGGGIPTPGGVGAAVFADNAAVACCVHGEDVGVEGRRGGSKDPSAEAMPAWQGTEGLKPGVALEVGTACNGNCIAGCKVCCESTGAFGT